MPSVQLIIVRVIYIVVLGFSLIGCAGDEEVSKAPASAKPDTASNATEKSSALPMSQFLKRQADKAVPGDNYHLNSKKAAEILAQIEAAEGDPYDLKFKYAVQLLRSGQSEKASKEFLELIERRGGLEGGLTPKTKLEYELLAISYLRKGEQDNCIANHNSESCIIPLSDIAVHQNKAGSEQALDIYRKLTTRFPQDNQTAYLFRIATMTLGQESGLNLDSKSDSIKSWANVATKLRLDAMGIAGGCAVDDFNGDGMLDIIASSYGYNDRLKYFQNDGAGGFVDQSQAAGLKDVTGGINLNHVDFNNDGILDVYVMRGGWLGEGGKQPNSLLQGKADGTFTDVTRESGLFSLRPTHASVWADFNLDGNVDLFVGNETSPYNYGEGSLTDEFTTHPCELFINNGDGTFTESAQLAGIALEKFVKGVTSADYDNDGLPDLFVSLVDENNLLFFNRTTEGGRTEFERSDSCGATSLKYSFPTWSWDFNNDGHEDIFVAAYQLNKLNKVAADYFAELRKKPGKRNAPALYKNNGDGTFTDVARQSGLNKSIFAMGCNYGDLDNDGFLDCYIGTGAPDFRSIVPNRMFRNRSGKSFSDVSFKGFSHIQKGHGIGWGDLDNDGDQDIYTVMGGAYEGDIAPNALFENPGTDNNWVTLNLVGTSSNRAAIGARVELSINENGVSRTIHRTVGTGSSFGSNSIQLEVGIGKAESIDSLKIRWPKWDRETVEIANLPVNKKLRIVEGNEAGFEDVTQTKIQFVGD